VIDEAAAGLPFEPPSRQALEPPRRVWPVCAIHLRIGKSGGVREELLYPDDVFSMPAELWNRLDDAIRDHQLALLHQNPRRRGDDRLRAREEGEQGFRCCIPLGSAKAGAAEGAAGRQLAMTPHRHLGGAQRIVFDRVGGLTEERVETRCVEVELVRIWH